MERELSAIVNEVSEKTWEGEIESFRRSIILQRVKEAVLDLEKDWDQSSWLKKLPKLPIRPGKAFLYSIPAIWFFFKGYGLIGPVHWLTSLMGKKGKSEEAVINWDHEKHEIQEQVQELVTAFQNQLLFTRDFVRAELELNFESLEENESPRRKSANDPAKKQ